MSKNTLDDNSDYIKGFNKGEPDMFPLSCVVGVEDCEDPDSRLKHSHVVSFYGKTDFIPISSELDRIKKSPPKNLSQISN